MGGKIGQTNQTAFKKVEKKPVEENSDQKIEKG